MAKQFRLRLTDVELKSLIMTLGDVVESRDLLLSYGRNLPRNDPRITSSADGMLLRNSRENSRAILRGRKTHMRSMALLVCSMLVDES